MRLLPSAERRHWAASGREAPQVGLRLGGPAEPAGRPYAYGCVLRDAAVAFYATRTTDPGQPPIGERTYEFVVGVYHDVLRADDVPVVGKDPCVSPDDAWPPPFRVQDPISGSVSIYERGTFRQATADEARDLEPAAVWDRDHLISRLTAGRASAGDDESDG